MTRHVAILVVTLALCPAPALGGLVFFDDFDGDALLPHWSVPPPSFWEYNVSDSMLNVTGLLVPSDPKIPSNSIGMGAPFAPQSDFQMDVWMGWDAGDAPHRFELRVIGGLGSIIARFTYRNEFAGDPAIIANVTGQSVTMPAPAPGLHQFTITRTGTEFDFSLNGSAFATFSGGSSLQATGVGFFFLGPYPGELGAFHVDKVQVIPTPSALLLIPAFALASRRGRKRAASIR